METLTRNKLISASPGNIYLFKVNTRNTRKNCEIFSKLTIKTPERCNWKPRRWVRLNLIFTMRDIYISSNLYPLTKFSSSRRTTEFKDILPWNISLIIRKIIPISTRIVISLTMKRGIPFWLWRKINRNWGN